MIVFASFARRRNDYEPRFVQRVLLRYCDLMNQRWTEPVSDSFDLADADSPKWCRSVVQLF